MNSTDDQRVRSSPDGVPLARWRKSSYSSADGDDCLEVNDAHDSAAVPVRDSKNPHGPAVLFGASAWAAFVASL
ncbi:MULTISPECIES: DUF397 domain-containing protein [Streptomyces]|uniref:Regulatory protein n=1 Tax=Streptomyces alboflavus TaxID=67267 RepID=A0A1Z1WFX6_9ACTN|nr:DUF397 domain-containing protein [Streptomyces alboflavus]ARX85341.1 regulatory protein [Streptomyces alboflavus]